jgi:hypothetical protein
LQVKDFGTEYPSDPTNHTQRKKIRQSLILHFIYLHFISQKRITVDYPLQLFVHINLDSCPQTLSQPQLVTVRSSLITPPIWVATNFSMFVFN